jgi:hypothetical protein
LRCGPSSDDLSFQDEFGGSVAISGDGKTIVVGARGHDSEAGAVYVFSEPSSGGWQDATQTAELTASDGVPEVAYDQPGDELGSSVAISEDGSTIVSGAPNRSSGEGAAYVFTKPVSGGWVNATQTAELGQTDLQAAGEDNGSALGASVAISDDGDTIATGVQNRDVGGTTTSGAVELYTEPASGGWQNATQSAELTSVVSALSDVAISGNGDTVVADGGYGSTIALFEKPASGGWQNAASSVQLSTDAAAFSGGPAISEDGTAVVVGLEIDEDEDTGDRDPGAGAAYEFHEPSSGGWRSETEGQQFGSARTRESLLVVHPAGRGF